VPHREPLLASYNDKDVIAYLEEVVTALADLAQLMERTSIERVFVVLDTRLLRLGGIKNLPAQLDGDAARGQVLVACVQTDGELEGFCGAVRRVLTSSI
jgi:hypothetical protein